jgi:hypothetical protein
MRVLKLARCLCPAAFTIAILLGLIRSAAVVHAGVINIGELFTAAPPNDLIAGIAFDGTPNPLIIDSENWSLSRVSLQNAAAISTTFSTPFPNASNQALAYDDSTASFYTMKANEYLYKIQSGTLANSPVGNGVGAFFNFNSLAVDPSGNLWLATDNDGNSLWEIDKQTGVGTLRTTINLGVNNQITALAIDNAGQFFVYSTTPVLDGQPTPTFIYQVNPNTGAATQAAQVFLNTRTSFGIMLAMAYDPMSKGYYGIEQNDLANPRTFELVQITDLPGPSILGFLSICTVAGLRRRAKIDSNDKYARSIVAPESHQ